MNIASSKDLGSSTGRYEQLYIQVLSLAELLPAVMSERIDGITSRLRIASQISFSMVGVNQGDTILVM